MSTPFSPNSLSLGVYAEGDTPADMLESVFAQARAAEGAGIAGVTVSEHHAGFPSYLPNPLQVSGWILHRTGHIWAGPCPLILPLRSTVLVIEEIAWMAAAFPGRVCLGVAPGYAEEDFRVLGAEFDGRGSRLGTQLHELIRALRGDAREGLDRDVAVAAVADTPVPVVAAAGTEAAARRAARAGAGVMTDSMAGMEQVGRVWAAYEEAGGSGPRVLNRRVWIGDPPAALLRAQMDTYREAASTGNAWMSGGPSGLVSGRADEVAEQLGEAFGDGAATHLGLKVHVAGLELRETLGQIEALGEVVTALDRRADRAVDPPTAPDPAMPPTR